MKKYLPISIALFYMLCSCGEPEVAENVSGENIPEVDAEPCICPEEGVNEIEENNNLHEMKWEQVGSDQQNLMDMAPSVIDLHRFSTTGSFNIPMGGGSGSMKINSLSIENMEYATALITFDAEIEEETDFIDEQSMFISLGFFDENKEFLFGHSLCTDHGSSIGGVYTDMQATPLDVEMLSETKVSISGTAEIFLHHAFLYSPDMSAGGILNIRYCTVKAFHLMAG